MKPRKSHVPDWFDLAKYRMVQSWEDWAYEVWVRACYYFREESGKQQFFLQSDPNGESAFCNFGAPIPRSTERFQDFLAGKLSYREQFADQSRFWVQEAGAEVDPLVVHDLNDNPLLARLAELPAHEHNRPALAFVTDWFERNQPISVNLARSDKDIISAFSKLLSERRREQQDFLYHATQIEGKAGKWKNNYIWKGAKLLALFDLLYWNHAFQYPTYAEIGAAVWPEEVGVDLVDRVKKTGLPQISKFYSIQTAKALFAQQFVEPSDESNVSSKMPE